MLTKAVVYSDDYVEKLFNAWYKMGCPSPAIFHEYLEEHPEDSKDEFGRIPGKPTLITWYNEKLWLARKDILDARVQTQLDDDLVALKVNMLREQAAAFRAVRQKALEFLLNHDFDTSASAVSAFVKASQEERIAFGLSKTIQKMSEMDDEALTQAVKELAAKTGGILDAEEVEIEEEPVDEG